MLRNKEVTISKKAKKRIEKGGLWIYRSEIQEDISSIPVGELVQVKTETEYIGRGYIHPKQTISIRLLTQKNEPITSDLFEKKILTALDLREKIQFPADEPRRLINSEGDNLPGLVLDQYGKILVFQIFTQGMEKWKNLLLNLFKKIFHPSALLEKSIGALRKQEGLEEICYLHFGEILQPALFKIDGLSFWIDLLEGHKTGFYLDQRENRKKLKDYVKGGAFLDPFSYTGGMSLYAAAFGAAHVEAVEDSHKIIPLLEKNIQENKMKDRILFFQGNAFHFLREKILEKKVYDTILLDPSSFAKNKKDFKKALSGYKEIHLSALKLLHSGGFLITYSCSQNITEKDFLEMILEAAADTKRSLQIIERQGASRDHPVRGGMPETEYLKGFIFRVV